MVTAVKDQAAREDRRRATLGEHLFTRPVAFVDFDFAAFTGCDLQWVFRPSPHTDSTEHVVVSLSAAERYMPMDKRQLIDTMYGQRSSSRVPVMTPCARSMRC